MMMMILKLNFWKDLTNLETGLCIQTGKFVSGRRSEIVSVLSESSSVVAHKAPFWCFEIWCWFISVWNLKVLETEKQLQLVATNPGWQSSSYLCSYIVALLISLLTFFRCKSLHCINWVATKNLAVDCWNLCFWKNLLHWTWIWQDSQRWFKGPTPVVHWSHTCGTNEPKKLLFS